MKTIDFTTRKEISLSNEETTCAEQMPSAEEFIFDETDFDMPAFILKRTYDYDTEQPLPPIQKYRGQVYEREAFVEMMQKYFTRNKGRK